MPFFDVFEFVIVYFFFVETKGKTLEELDFIFEAPNPRKASVDPDFLSSTRLASGFEAENKKEQLLNPKPDVEHLSTAESV